MDIFVHYPNQLITSFEKAKYSTSFFHLISILNGTTPKVLDFKLTECKRIKKRHDSNEPCSQKIPNYDQYLIRKLSEQLMESIGCVPIYMKTQLSNHTALRDCTSAVDLKKAYRSVDNVKAVLLSNKVPCDEMLILTIDSINNNPRPIPEDISIQFHYTEKEYEEIKYIRAIGFESWLSNVGGFVGILLGYSLRELPELILVFANMFNCKRRTHWKGM